MDDHFGSSYAAGLISVLVLALASFTRFGVHLQGPRHVIYVVSAGTALYFNVLAGVGPFSEADSFLLVVQCVIVLPFIGVTAVTLARRGVR
jgi:hypothetical protein